MERATDRETTLTLKVVLLGDLGVGKTCLRSQFVHHVFTNAYKATIGGDYLTTTMTVQKSPEIVDEGGTSPDPELHVVNLQIWDTAGQERFNLISQAFYRGADVAVLVYDVTNYESVLSMRDWFARFMKHCHVEKPGVIIVGNKVDRTADVCVDREEIHDVLCRNGPAVSIESYVENWDSDVIEVTCKQLTMVQGVFKRVAEIGLALDNTPRKMVGFDSIDLDERLATSTCAC